LAPLFRDVKTAIVILADFNDPHKGVLGLYKLSRRIRNLNIDAVADLHNVLRTNILKYFLFGIKFNQINKGRSQKRELTEGINFSPLRSTPERYADVFRSLGFSYELNTPSPRAPKKLANSILNALGRFSSAVIGVAPFAAYASKTYPILKMDKVIYELQKKHIILLFGGGPEESQQLQKLASKYTNVFSVAAKFSLEHELDIISNLKVMLSMDSSNGHMAAMLGVNVVTLWGVTHPYAGFAPFNQDVTNNLLADRFKYPKIPTSIYGNTFPEGYELAIETIPVKSVLEAVNSNL
jgi:ADP-heptose:LPS heptosyltransferase